MIRKTIFVAKPSMPPLAEFIPYLEEIWDSKILTNNGKFHQQLETELCQHLGVNHVSLFSSGTIALMTALKALKLTGDVITTPYTFVATTNSLRLNNLNPIFVDIDATSFNLDPLKIEAAITPETSAIFPVHSYGIPCDVEAIDKIASKHKLKVIYDAAHAFGVENPSGSILNHGDFSVLSFHATKVFNTFEGGAVICPDENSKHQLDQLKNFGFQDELNLVDIGLNGKMSELNAAFGLLQLKYVDGLISKRAEIARHYLELLNDIEGIKPFDFTVQLKSNFSYFPIIIEESYPLSRDGLMNVLAEQGINCRRYFYPLISEFEPYKSARHHFTPIATLTSNQVLCLPIYPDLGLEQQELTVKIIRSCGK